MNIQLAGCVIINDSGNICLLHRNKKGVTQWELPGGKVEPDETSEQAAVRELQEELGVVVSIQKKLGGDSFVENGITFEYTWFLAVIESGEAVVREPETFDDMRYFAQDELDSLELSGNMKKLSARVISGDILLV